MTTTNLLAASPLYAIGLAFAALSGGVCPLTLDGGLVNEPGSLTVGEAQKKLLEKSTSLEVRDAVWAELVRRSRADGAEWTVAAVGMALPALKSIAGQFGLSFDGPLEDLDAEILAAFLEHLAAMDIDRPGILARLRWTAFRAAQKAVTAEIDHVRSTATPKSTPPRMPWGHEDLVLARAEREEVLTSSEADLIGMTRLEGVELADAAEMLGVTKNAAKIRRQRAEARLVAWIQGRPVPTRAELAQSRTRA